MEQIVSFQPGEIILEEGEVGQAMYFIRLGSVEVTKRSGPNEVLLTLQDVGEVVGLLSFYSGEKRLATARARTYVECLKVEKKDSKDILSNLPKWFQIVMREFTLRLVQSNNQIVELHEENNNLRLISMNRLWIAIQYVDTLSLLSKSNSKKLDDGREVVFLDAMLDQIASVLRHSREELLEVQEILKDSALMKVELDPDQNREIVQLERIEKLAWFAEFAHAVRTGPKKKLLDTRISYKQRRQLYALKEYVQKQERDTHATYTEDRNALSIRFEQLTKQPLDASTLDLAKQLKLIDITKKNDQDIVSFQASTLVRTVLCLNVIRRLLKDPRLQEEEEPEADVA